jgi:hypothetical protein
MVTRPGLVTCGLMVNLQVILRHYRCRSTCHHASPIYTSCTWSSAFLRSARLCNLLRFRHMTLQNVTGSEPYFLRQGLENRVERILPDLRVATKEGFCCARSTG